jgi:hypothetical protein
MLNILNDKLRAVGRPPLGFVNPLFYQMAREAPETFNIITIGGTTEKRTSK